MALSRPSFFVYLKTLTINHRRLHLSPSFISLRFLSFATPEEAAAERRRRKRIQRIDPPLTSLRYSPPKPNQPRQPPSPATNPNSPKLPEPISSLSGPRLILHNRILTLIRSNDLEEAALLTRHSVYSNCRPTIFTVNAVLTAQHRAGRYSDLLSLHRFINQAGITANIITHNLLLNTYCDCRKTDTALEFYKQLIDDAPFNPSPTTFRILIKGLIDNNKVDRAMELKDEMLSKGFSADPIVYNHLMSGHVKNSNPEGVFTLYEELKEKLGVVLDGIVYGNLMKGFFLRGMQKEAMETYHEAIGENSKVKMSAMAFNYVLDALSTNQRFEEALKLFQRILAEHNPPRILSVNLGTFNVMANGYCFHGMFKEAIDVFKSMGEKKCIPDILSYNNLISQLCNGGLLGDAEKLFHEMGDADEYTYVILMDACFKENRADDASAYFSMMVERGLRPNLKVYDKLVRGLVNVGKIDDAKSFYDMMARKLKMDDASHQFIMGELFKVGRFEEVLGMVNDLLDDEGGFSEELHEFVDGELKKIEKEAELVSLVEKKKREKEEAKAKEIAEAEAAKASAKAAVASLIPSKLFEKENAGLENEGNTKVGVTVSAAIGAEIELKTESENNKGYAKEEDTVSSTEADIESKTESENKEEDTEGDTVSAMDADIKSKTESVNKEGDSEGDTVSAIDVEIESKTESENMEGDSEGDTVSAIDEDIESKTESVNKEGDAGIESKT